MTRKVDFRVHHKTSTRTLSKVHESGDEIMHEREKFSWLNTGYYHPWKWFQPITDQITVVIFHEIATVSWFQTKSQTVWFLSWKSDTKIKFSSAWNHYITSKKSQKGEKWSDSHIHYTKFPPKRLKECSLQSAGNSSVRAFTHEWSFSARDIFVFKNTFFCSGMMINM